MFRCALAMFFGGIILFLGGAYLLYQKNIESTLLLRLDQMAAEARASLVLRLYEVADDELFTISRSEMPNTFGGLLERSQGTLSALFLRSADCTKATVFSQTPLAVDDIPCAKAPSLEKSIQSEKNFGYLASIPLQDGGSLGGYVNVAPIFAAIAGGYHHFHLRDVKPESNLLWQAGNQYLYGSFSSIEPGSAFDFFLAAMIFLLLGTVFALYADRTREDYKESLLEDLARLLQWLRHESSQKTMPPISRLSPFDPLVMTLYENELAWQKKHEAQNKIISELEEACQIYASKHYQDKNKFRLISRQTLLWTRSEEVIPSLMQSADRSLRPLKELKENLLPSFIQKAQLFYKHKVKEAGRLDEIGERAFLKEISEGHLTKNRIELELKENIWTINTLIEIEEIIEKLLQNEEAKQEKLGDLGTIISSEDSREAPFADVLHRALVKAAKGGAAALLWSVCPPLPKISLQKDLLVFETAFYYWWLAALSEDLPRIEWQAKETVRSTSFTWKLRWTKIHSYDLKFKQRLGVFKTLMEGLEIDLQISLAEDEFSGEIRWTRTLINAALPEAALHLAAG